MHTKGPWIVDGLSTELNANVRIATKNDNPTLAITIGEAFFDPPEMLDPGIGIVEAEHNARLMAEAPVLAAVLKKAIVLLIMLGDFVGNQYERCEIIGEACTVLERALGDPVPVEPIPRNGIDLLSALHDAYATIASGSPPYSEREAATRRILHQAIKTVATGRTL